MSTSSDPSVKMGVRSGSNFKSSQILNCYWTDVNGNKIKSADLENTVYFNIITDYFQDGDIIKLKLEEDDFMFFPDTKFGGKEIHKEVTIRGNKGKVELYLDRSWSDLVADDVGEIIELYWVVTFMKVRTSEGITLPRNIKLNLYPRTENKFLLVGFSKRKLFIKPSTSDEAFPELYTTDGEQMILVQFLQDQAESYAKDAAKEYALNKAQKEFMALALIKLEKGYMVDNMGMVHGPDPLKGPKRKMLDRTISTNNGEIIKTRMGKDFYLMSNEGLRTSKGISQIDYWMTNMVRIEGFVKHTGMMLDVFDVIEFGRNPDHSINLSIPLPTASLTFAVEAIGIMGMMELDKVYNDQMYDQYLQKRLDDAKRQGLEAVRELLKEYEFKQAKYQLLDISKKMASDITSGKYKSIRDIEFDSFNIENKNTTILYKTTTDPYSKEEIAIIETFFEKK